MCTSPGVCPLPPSSTRSMLSARTDVPLCFPPALGLKPWTRSTREQASPPGAPPTSPLQLLQTATLPRGFSITVDEMGHPHSSSCSGLENYSAPPLVHMEPFNQVCQFHLLKMSSIPSLFSMCLLLPKVGVCICLLGLPRQSSTDWVA